MTQNRLFKRFSLLILGLVFVFVVLFSTAAIKRERSLLYENMKQSGFGLANSLALTSGNAIILRDYAFLVDLNMMMVRNEPQLLYSIFTGESGASMIHYAESWKQAVLSDPVSVRIHASHEPLSVEYFHPEFQEEVYEFSTPVIVAENKLGVIRLGFSLKSLEANLRKMYFQVGVIAISFIGLGLIASFFLARGITQPLSLLVEGVRRLADKDFSHQITSSRDDEIGVLIHGFNDMAAQIRLREESLSRANEELEERVSERTRELEREIQERSNAQDLLKHTVTALERSNRELEQFAYVASHDLQEPLRKILAFGDRLKKEAEPDLNEKAVDFLHRMLGGAARMKQLIEDILQFSRVTTKARRLEPVSLGPVIRDVLSDLEVRVTQTGGEVVVGEFPTLKADRSQMRQVFQNLIANALKFVRSGVPPRIEVSGRDLGDGFAEVCVADNGIGIDEKYADRIFQPFQRLHGRDEFEGTGMGLAICQKIVQRHGGMLSLRSRPGEGSVFVMTLPVWQAVC